MSGSPLRASVAPFDEARAPVGRVRSCAEFIDGGSDEFLQRRGDARSHLGDVHAEVFVESRREVQGGPCELRVLVDGPDSRPGSGLDHAVAPVEVDSLLTVPFARPAEPVERLTTDPATGDLLIDLRGSVDPAAPEVCPVTRRC